MLNRRLEILDPAVQQGIVDSIVSLAKAKAVQGTPAELAADLTALATLAENFTIDTFEEGKFSSQQLNSQFEKIYMAMVGLYTHLNKADSSLLAQQSITNSDLSTLKQGVFKILEDIKLFKFLKLNPTYNDIRYISFVDGQNYASQPLAAIVDPNSRSLVMKTANRTNLSSRSGNFKPSTSVVYISDNSTSDANTGYDSDNAVDGDDTTFWAEVLLADNPVQTEYSSSIYSGYIVQLKVDYKQLELINLIQVHPFGEFPVRILNLETSTDDITYTTTAGFVEPDATLSWYSISFAPVLARYVRVTLLQENYKTKLFNIPKSVYNNALFMNQIADTELRVIYGDREDSDIESRTADYSPASRRIINGLAKLGRELGSTLISPISSLTDIVRQEISPILSKTGSSLSVRGLTLPSKKDETVSVYKTEYILGLHSLEASLVLYNSLGLYTSPTYQLTGTLFDVTLDTIEKVVTLTDPSGISFPANTIEYSVDIAPFRTKALHPTGLSFLWEVLDLNQVGKGVLRFTATSITYVFQDGVLLDSTKYTIDLSSNSIIVGAIYFSPQSIYLVKYIPTADQDKLDVQSEFNSFPLSAPEQFSGTDSTGAIKLSVSPYIDYNIINDVDLFYRPDSNDARYYYRSDVDQQLIDAEVYGSFSNTLATTLGLADASVTLTSVSGLYNPSLTDTPGLIKIDNELIQYSSLSGQTLSGLTRGVNSTQAADHMVGSLVSSATNMYYEPLTVLVNGIRAHNLTDYLTGSEPAFSIEAPGTLVHSYIQAGPNVYFAAPLIDASITVQYNILSQYLKLNALMRSATSGRRAYTPEVSEIKLLLNSAEI